MLHVLKLKLGGMRAVAVIAESQWMDSPSRQLMQLAMKEVSPLLAIFTVRPTDSQVGGKAEEANGDASGGSSLELPPLNETQVQELLTGALGVSEVPKSVYETVHKRERRGHIRARVMVATPRPTHSRTQVEER